MRYDDTHCIHGCYIGYPGGPDYLCQYCEDGISVAELVEMNRRDRIANARLLVTMMENIQAKVPFKSSTATWLVQYVYDEVDRKGLSEADIAELVGA